MIAFCLGAFHRSANAGSESRVGAGLAVANGLSWIEALRALTTAPATLYGLSNRYGTVKAGRDADLVIWDGDPLSTYGVASQVFIDGELYFDRSLPGLGVVAQPEADR